MRLFLLSIIVIFCNQLLAQSPFERNTLIESKNSVEQITPVGENFLVQLRGSHPLYNTYHYQCLNASGEVVWELNEGFAYMEHTEACVRDDGSVVIFNFDNGCDYISPLYEVIIVDAQGSIIHQWTETNMDTSPLVQLFQPVTTLASQNKLAIASNEGVQLFDLTTGTLGEAMIFSPTMLSINAFAKDEENLIFYDSQFVVNFNWVTGVSTSFELAVPTEHLTLHGTELYGIGNTQIHKYSFDGTVLETYTLSEGSFLAHSTWNSNVLMAVVSNPLGLEEAKIFSETLSELGSFEIVDSHLFDISIFVNAGDQYWLGGKNATVDTSGSRAIVKSYPFFAAPFSTQQNIGISDIQISNLRFIPIQNPPPDNTVHWVVGDVAITTTNYSEEVVNNWSIHYNLPSWITPFCSNAVDFEAITASLGVGQSVTQMIQDVPFRYIYNVEEGATVDYEFCATSLGPNNFLDDYPDNDSFCIESSVIYTGVKEIDALGFSYLVQEESIQLTCNDAIQYVLVDMQGRVIDFGKKSKGTNTISTQALSSGVYAVTVWNPQFSKTIRFSK